MDFADEETVKAYIGLAGDKPKDELISLVCKNANIIITSKLKAAKLNSNPKEIPVELTAAANYYALQDLLSIVQINNEHNDISFLKKADLLIDEYIESHKQLYSSFGDQ